MADKEEKSIIGEVREAWKEGYDSLYPEGGPIESLKGYGKGLASGATFGIYKPTAANTVAEKMAMSVGEVVGTVAPVGGVGVKAASVGMKATGVGVKAAKVAPGLIARTISKGGVMVKKLLDGVRKMVSKSGAKKAADVAAKTTAKEGFKEGAKKTAKEGVKETAKESLTDKAKKITGINPTDGNSPQTGFHPSVGAAGGFAKEAVINDIPPEDQIRHLATVIAGMFTGSLHKKGQSSGSSLLSGLTSKLFGKKGAGVGSAASEQASNKIIQQLYPGKDLAKAMSNVAPNAPARRPGLS